MSWSGAASNCGPTASPAPVSKGTPVRTVRVPDDVWLPAKVKAYSEGTTLGVVLLAALEKYLAK